MRYIPLLLLLASCQTWGWSETADALMPDEFTMGEGSSSMNTHTTGGYIGHQDMYEYDGDGEGESTYAALTWHIPSFKSDNGMSRETQRNFALLVDHMVAEEKLDEARDEDEEVAATASVGPLTMNLREGVTLPSKEILFGVLGALLLIALFIRYKANAARRRW
jgi:hypothetical protein